MSLPSNGAEQISSSDWEKMLTLLSDGVETSLQNESLKELLAKEEDKLKAQRKMMFQELRQDDPFYYFSVPGALRHDLVDSEDTAKELLSKLGNSSVKRKTRVTCEVHSDLMFEEIMKELEAEAQEMSDQHFHKEKSICSAALHSHEAPLGQVIHNTGSHRSQTESRVVAHAA